MTKILVVEDTDDSREYLKILLELLDYEVLEAANGREAIEAARHNSPDLVFMDISMPGMDGLAATQAIREFKDAAILPIVAITSYGLSYYRKAIEAGCNDMVPKPIDPDTIKSLLTKYCSS